MVGKRGYGDFFTSRLQQQRNGGFLPGIILLTQCYCVFFPFILDIKFVGCTSRGHIGGRPHRISHPPSFCGASLNFSREKDSVIPFLVDREVEFCVLTT